MRERARFTWMNGQVLPSEQAVLSVTTEAVLRGANVFEGIRAYPRDGAQGLALFRCADHLRRLHMSAKIMRMPIPYSDACLTKALGDLIQANEFQLSTHLRLVCYFGDGPAYAYKSADITTGVFIVASEHGGLVVSQTGIRSCISTWRRNADDASPSRVKAAGNYHNSRLAQVEADTKGFGTPIMLNSRGRIAESPSSCFMMVRDGALITPPVSADILEGITRDAVMTLAREVLGLTVVEREIDRTEVYIADEAFFCGTGHEITPILSVDDYPIGDEQVGSVTHAIQSCYLDVVSGRLARWRHWLTPIIGFCASV